MDGGKAPAPEGGGGGKKKRNNRNKKKGGASTGGAAGGTKDGPSGGGAQPSSAGRGSGKSGGGSRNKRRGGGGRGGGGGGSSNAESSRFNKNASSPLQLPHVKITLRNIIVGNTTTSTTANNTNNNGESNKHSSITEIVQSIKTFLNGAFPSGRWGPEESEAYMLAWQREKEEFEKSKAMFADAADANNNNGTTTGAGGASTASATSGNSSRPFSSGWVYDSTNSSTTLPTNRSTLLPTSSDVVTKLLSNQTDKQIRDTSNINWVIDTAMSQMMGECGKQYLGYVGGRIVLDEESCVHVGLAERVAVERGRIEEEKEQQKAAAEEESAEANDAVDGSEQTNGANNDGAGEKKDEASVEAVTRGIEKLSTNPVSKPTQQQPSIPTNTPAIRIRILSVTPAKKSKRRGEIAGKVTLALYPPDPCMLFKEGCRDAGQMAGELHLEKIAKKYEEEKAAAEKAEEEAKEDAEKEAEKTASVAEEGVDKPAEEDGAAKDGTAKEEEEGAPSESKNEDVGKKEDDAKESTEEPKKKVVSKSAPPKRNIPDRVPQIPYYPLLSPAERSRAVARSRVLLSRTIEALKIHAAAAPAGQYGMWEIMESSSQKTWKSKPHPMVASLMMAGGDEQGQTSTLLHDLVVENDTAKAATAAAKKGRGSRYDSRADRYDSTLENSEDYKMFMESFQSGDAIPSVVKKDDKGGKDGNKKGDAKSVTVEDKPIPVDEEGRPLSAIVMHLRSKQEEANKVKAEAAAAAAKARAAVAAAKEKARKEKLKAKKEASRKKKKEAARASKKSSLGGGTGGGRTASSSNRPSSAGSKSRGVKGSASNSMAMPPPGAMLLKKGGAGSAIPPSGFGS